MDLYLESAAQGGLSDEEIGSLLRQSLEGRSIKKALIIPPDITRFHSNAGFITNQYYHLLTGAGARVDILPALGTHEAMSREEAEEMYGDIPYERFFAHNWRSDVVKLGEIPADTMRQFTDGLWDEPVVCEINRMVMDDSYDLILSVGQVVPHEVIGMANHSKNLFVGVGGSGFINRSHMVGAICDLEKMMGKDHTPVRKMFDYCLEHFLAGRPVVFALTVTTAPGGVINTHGLYIGDTRKTLERAVALSQQKNINFVEKPIKKCVVWLDPKEFRSTWLGNKSVYRTRLAVADGGELLVLAPGVTKFGEDAAVDELIRKYGYAGRMKVLELFRENDDLQQNMGAAAHLIHGSSDGRFTVTYAVKAISQEEIRGVHYNAADFDEMAGRYDPEKLAPGWNTLPDGEEIYFIPNPALGLWIDKGRFEGN